MEFNDTTPLLSPADAAKLLGVTPAAVVAMAKRGALPHLRTAGGRRLFRLHDVAALVNARAAHLRSPSRG
jgi:excisionase family DNA binding protein